MAYKNKTAVFARAGYSIKKKAALGITVVLLGLSQQALADVEYYDINQGSQIPDLSATGKTASTNKYGVSPLGFGAILAALFAAKAAAIK